MAQGTSKLASGKAASYRRSNKDPKKGARVIPPKKAAAIKSFKLHKQLSAKINNSVEQQMVSAASGGKLTIMKAVTPTTPSK
ncbi:hypothetical protein FRB96_002326 [Tulasnella sp. 330]|nr:hypothetical protein FRB96_002326 [Tulasnella sp. 330]KAG8876827.1 hypothetical protein FRB97_003893 [Tulasnella sp. 331]KAG8877408.1 hypothetical protein FRB98_006701 [Tulasnella sp. 332]